MLYKSLCKLVIIYQEKNYNFIIRFIIISFNDNCSNITDKFQLKFFLKAPRIMLKQFHDYAAKFKILKIHTISNLN